jgi:hypothetical protein
MDELVKQVQILLQTVEAMTLRGEQLFKMQEEVLTLSRGAITDMKNEVHVATLELQAVKDQQELINEAQKASLSDLDAGVDDLAKISVALLQVQKQLNPSSQGQEAPAAK